MEVARSALRRLCAPATQRSLANQLRLTHAEIQWSELYVLRDRDQRHNQQHLQHLRKIVNSGYWLLATGYFLVHLRQDSYGRNSGFSASSICTLPAARMPNIATRYMLRVTNPSTTTASATPIDTFSARLLDR